ncbi:corneodesmosin-like [Penaeus vannamei]|uniref:corneodesmosin-like n=1 Tax=Penaeus vannamei TaxID=6689 RepID=UPI00387F6278
MKPKCCFERGCDPEPLKTVLTGRVADTSSRSALGLFSSSFGARYSDGMDRFPQSLWNMSYDRGVAAYERETVYSERGPPAPKTSRGQGNASRASGGSKPKAAPAIERGPSARGGGGASGTPSRQRGGGSGSGKVVAVRQRGGAVERSASDSYERGIVSYERATADLNRGTISYEQGTVLYERGAASSSSSRGSASRGRAIAGGGGGGRGGRKTSSVSESGVVVHENLSYGHEGDPRGTDVMLFFM